MSLIKILFLVLFVVAVYCRPSQSEENDRNDELEYEEEDEDNVDDAQFGEEYVNSHDMDQKRKVSERNSLQKKLAEDQMNSDTPEYKHARSRDVRNNQFVSQDHFEVHKQEGYTDNSGVNEESEAAHHSNPNDHYFENVHNAMLMESPLSKRNYESKKSSEIGDSLFGGNDERTSKLDRNTHSKQYFNSMQQDLNDEDTYYIGRERREVKTPEAVTVKTTLGETEKSCMENSDNKNEEMEIKRNVRKMTTGEFQQLLNTLSEEKRVLLKKIMEEDDVSEKSLDTINKREITKKAGAVEDNGYMESSQSESGKLEGMTAIDITTAFPSTQTASKQLDTTVLSQKSSKDTDENTSDSTNPEKSNDSDDDKNPMEIVSKNEKKREVKSKVASQCQKNDPNENEKDESDFSSRDADLPQFLDDVEESRIYDSSKIYKREAENDPDLELKLKALEESFPNSNMYDESEPYSGPLIRVKRQASEPVVKKRSAPLLPRAKVGYYPSKHENEDTDEGNEFDDEGFYDPSLKLVNNNEDGNLVNPKSKMSFDNANLGTDTDNVLSGVEDVDENLMYAASRNRRKTDGSLEDSDDNLIQSDSAKNSDSKDLNNPNYESADSFGGYPRSYEGDLGRYKRVRRVKQSHATEDPSTVTI